MFLLARVQVQTENGIIGRLLEFCWQNHSLSRFHGTFQVLVDPHGPIDDESVRLRIVHPATVAVFPQQAAVFSVEGTKCAGHGMEADRSLGLKEQHHAVVVDEYRKLIHARAEVCR